MPKKWTPSEEREKFLELHHLYVKENKTIGGIARMLGIAYQTVFQRMQRLGIPSAPQLKSTYIAKRREDITIPQRYTERLAEFLGIMLGDGRLAPYQIVVTLGTKEPRYVGYVANLIRELFNVYPKIGIRKNGFRDVYLGSIAIVEWLKHEGLVHNKVALQVDAPKWIFTKREYLRGFLRGFFDTDGSIYRLRFGIQVAFTNRSLPLLQSSRRALLLLGYQPSIVSKYRLYLTRKNDIVRFFSDVRSANPKHQKRVKEFFDQIRAGTEVANRGRL